MSVLHPILCMSRRWRGLREWKRKKRYKNERQATHIKALINIEGTEYAFAYTMTRFEIEIKILEGQKHPSSLSPVSCMILSWIWIWVYARHRKGRIYIQKIERRETERKDTHKRQDTNEWRDDGWGKRCVWYWSRRGKGIILSSLSLHLLHVYRFDCSLSPHVLWIFCYYLLTFLKSLPWNVCLDENTGEYHLDQNHEEHASPLTSSCFFFIKRRNI